MVSTTGYIDAEQHGPNGKKKVKMVLPDLILFGMLSHISDLKDVPRSLKYTGPIYHNYCISFCLWSLSHPLQIKFHYLQ